MHLVALGYPTKPTYAEKRAAKEFFESFTHLIPCPTCKMHYANHLKNNPLTPNLDTRHDLFQWTIRIHNLVNKDLGKPEYTDTDAIAFYHRLGELGRSPIWTPEDIHSIYLEAILKYGLVAIGSATLVGGFYYYMTTK
jgi:hypothetical protein